MLRKELNLMLILGNGTFLIFEKLRSSLETSLFRHDSVSNSVCQILIFTSNSSRVLQAGHTGSSLNKVSLYKKRIIKTLKFANFKNSAVCILKLL